MSVVVYLFVVTGKNVLLGAFVWANIVAFLGVEFILSIHNQLLGSLCED